MHVIYDISSSAIFGIMNDKHDILIVFKMGNKILIRKKIAFIYDTPVSNTGSTIQWYLECRITRKACRDLTVKPDPIAACSMSSSVTYTQ